VFKSPGHPYTRGLLDATRLGEHERRSRPTRLRGELQLSHQAARGCRLAARCLYAVDTCREQPQELQEVRPGQTVRCWRAAAGEI
jgi:oligopeptide/dipeptide ABC transporter ATP-binding protein